ncbi:hypothetical protein DV711_08900 [Motiliproteus coralliicola]|uniref:DUF5610 domain-containing protein n=1 Tax=Motiliproteus coralliicola TaxID=2283196 RepID=A0A369WKT8_9GAMM|nr:hypothetical protein [Motiliproteus coralliicola]RDE22688.1 hypothetical protein DV711_08900 [Motiliproteus coralliicola]
MQARQQQSLSLSLTTRDGDVVELEIFAAQSFSYQSDSAQLEAAGGQIELQQLQLESRSRQALDFRIQGELDAQELEDIERLMEQVGQLAGQFFDQQPQQSLEQLKELGLDTGEVVSLSLEMSRTEQYQYRHRAAQSYQQVAGVGSIDQGLQSYVAGLANALELADLFEDSMDSLLQLMQQAVRQLGAFTSEGLNETLAEAQQQQAAELNQELLEAVAAQVESDKNEDVD